MGLIDRLRELLPFGGDSTGTGEPAAESTGDEAGAHPDGARRCVICGTVVGPDATECPLCRPGELVPVDDGEPPDGPDPGSLGTDVRSEETTDADADRLRDVRRREDE